MAAGAGQPRACERCATGLARGQLYCLECGERCGPASPQLAVLLARVRGEPTAGAPGEPAPGGQRPGGQAFAGDGPAADRVAVPSASPSPTAWLGARIALLPLPSPRVSAALVLAFLAFGVLLGNVAGSRVDYTLAASAGRQVKLVLPSTTSSPPAASGSAGDTEVPEGEPPPSAEEPTPQTPVAATPAPVTTRTASSGPAPASSDAGKQGAGGSKTSPSSGGGSSLPPVKHVFVIMLSNQPYAAVFGPSSGARYLSHTLERKGELLVRYYGVAHEQLANGVALLSGQGATRATAGNCPVYSDIAPATVGAQQQVSGEGCVYPASTETLPGQLTAKHLTWRAYVQGMDEAGSAAGSATGACGHPAPGAPDPTATQSSITQPYATFRNPFVYFHSLVDSPACAANDVGLSRLSADLASARRTPNLSYIVPDRCHDGDAVQCAGGAPGGLGAADGFLAQVVPKILGSKAYKEDGLLLITVDQAPSGGEYGDSSSCCGQPQFPNLPAPSGPAAALGPSGGGQVGALLLSPFVKPGTTNQEPYNHFSLLRTIEDLFSLKHLGYAGLAHVSALEPSLFVARR